MSGVADVAIVGGGAAGVGAARRLAGRGLSVLLLEASDRLGGRGRTMATDGMALDLGCGWLHSAERNPWVAIAAERGFAVDRTPTAWGKQWRDLGFPPDERAAADAAFARFDAALADPPASDRAADVLRPGDPWNPWLEALSGYINGARLADLSIADYRAYDDAASETNWRVPGGYGALIAAACPAGMVALSSPVEAIDLGGADVRLSGPRGTVTARAAIVTVSTAMLAGGAIRILPEPADHLDAAAALPLGLADKLFLAVEGDIGLPADGHLIGDPRSACTGSYYLRPFGRPVIEGFYGADGAAALARTGLAGAADFAIGELAALLGNDVRRRLTLVAGSRWGRAAFVGGSYSHALPGRAAARGMLARPIDARLFFAGEATHATDFSTAHGALASGIRAAEEAIAALEQGRTA